MASISPERLVIRETLNKILSKCEKWSGLDNAQKETFIRRMERSCLEVTILACERDGVDKHFGDKKFKERYSSECYKLIQNLDVDLSNYLTNKILCGEIDPNDVAKLSSQEMCPEASAAERNEIEIRQKQKTNTKVSRAYTCRKCLHNETIYEDYQAARGDESSSISIKCLSCQNVWRK